MHSSFSRFLHMGKELLPVLGLVFFFLWLFNLMGSLQGKAAQLTGNNSGAKGWLLAMAMGVLSHGPIYPWYPLLHELQKKGTRPALLATFLYARSIKLPWLPVMAHYFGLSYMLTLTLLILLFSPLHGWLVENFCESQEQLGPKKQ
ncbi:conserved hypothetical protein [Thiolapillus brandeum]|uniref:Permease n=1 Tax=Thiolapillus brandeum TaxID=1076588 RepID=A0A7U6GJT3_9GAMM|nr:conserved hypothetical protein [Thiolapillus brandeum]